MRAALGLLVAAVVGAHLAFAFLGPRPRLWGDELSYAQHAHRDAKLGTTSVLPGRLSFRTQPELAARVYAKLPQGRDLQRSVALLHAALLAGLLAATYGQARLLGLGRPGALLAAGLVGTFPWLGFHVHSLWPEIPHAFLFATMLLLLLWSMERDRLLPLVPAGAAAALALLTKGVLQPFLLLFAAFLAVAFGRRARGRGRAAVWGRAVAAPALFLASTLAVLAPQAIANHRAGHGLRLAANRWWNLELGLTAGGGDRAPVNRVYLAASSDPVAREELARERTLRHLRETGLASVVAAQTRELRLLLFHRESSFERSLGGRRRWGPEPPAWLAALRAPARAMWYGLLALGAAGVMAVSRRGLGWAMVGSFTVLFLVACAAVPFNVRFALPAVPPLALLAAGVLERLATRRRAGTARPSGAPGA